MQEGSPISGCGDAGHDPNTDVESEGGTIASPGVRRPSMSDRNGKDEDEDTLEAYASAKIDCFGGLGGTDDVKIAAAYSGVNQDAEYAEASDVHEDYRSQLPLTRRQPHTRTDHDDRKPLVYIYDLPTPLVTCNYRPDNFYEAEARLPEVGCSPHIICYSYAWKWPFQRPPCCAFSDCHSKPHCA